MATAKVKMLMATQSCGCLSHWIIVDGDTTPSDIGEFYARAYKRGVPTREIQIGEELPAWECEVHERERRERMAMRKEGV